MGKFKTGLVKEAREAKQYDEVQKKLKKQHNIPTEQDVVVVEKRDAMKFIVRLIIRFAKFAALTALLTLAATGLIALVYPESRTILTQIGWGLMNQISDFFM